jgi:hypothetical protein
MRLQNIVFGVLPLIFATVVPSVAADIPLNTFYMTGDSLSCSTILPPGVKMEDVGYTPCLHVGPIAIGADSETVEMVVGAPFEAQPFRGGEIRYHKLNGKEPSSYIAVQYHEKRVVGVEVNGVQPPGKFSFASVEANDPTAKVIAALGNPSSQSRDEDRHLEKWGYLPFPFAFMVKDGVVVSFHITAPLGLSDAFAPLPTLQQLKC